MRKSFKLLTVILSASLLLTGCVSKEDKKIVNHIENQFILIEDDGIGYNEISRNNDNGILSIEYELFMDNHDKTLLADITFYIIDGKIEKINCEFTDKADNTYQTDYICDALLNTLPYVKTDYQTRVECNTFIVY